VPVELPDNRASCRHASRGPRYRCKGFAGSTSLGLNRAHRRVFHPYDGQARWLIYVARTIVCQAVSFLAEVKFLCLQQLIFLLS
jgi:hypothetical protein